MNARSAETPAVFSPATPEAPAAETVSIPTEKQPSVKSSADTNKAPVLEAGGETAAIQLPPVKSESHLYKDLSGLVDGQFDIAEIILALGEEDDFTLGTPAAETLERLGAMAKRAKEQLPDNPDVTDYYDALYDIVLGRKPLDSNHEEKAEDFDLSRAVFQHHGNCLAMGIAALAVARRMNAPINGTQVPGHFFLRGTAVLKGKGHEQPVNFDVTRPTPENWGKLDDDFYRKWRKFDSKAEASGEYLRPMTDRQVVSAFLSSRAGFLAREKNYDAALHDAQRALALNPRNIYALINQGYARENLKQLEEAENDYKAALEIDSQCVRALNNLAFVKIRDRRSSIYDLKRAEKYIEQALKIDPDQAYLFATKGEVCAARGDYREATRCLQTALSLSPKNSAYRERFMALREHLKRESDGDPMDKRSSTVPKRDKLGENR